MRKTIQFPIIKIDSFTYHYVDGDSSQVFHIYVNDQFYRAVNSREEVQSIISILMQSECDSL